MKFILAIVIVIFICIVAYGVGRVGGYFVRKYRKTFFEEGWLSAIPYLGACIVCFLALLVLSLSTTDFIWAVLHGKSQY